MKTKSLSKRRPQTGRRPSVRAPQARAVRDRSRFGRNGRNNRGKPDPVILANIISQIVRIARPEKIVLFGSAARGTMGPDSDYDLLVIKAGKFNHNRVTKDIYSKMSAGAAVDAVVVTPEEVERYRHTHCLVICPALRDGKVVYEA